jgi:hypothetical protein
VACLRRVHQPSWYAHLFRVNAGETMAPRDARSHSAQAQATV